jgi:hypothetical protein
MIQIKNIALDKINKRYFNIIFFKKIIMFSDLITILIFF